MNFTVFNEDYLENIFQQIRDLNKFPIRISYEPVKQLKTKAQLGFIFGGLMKVLRVYFYQIQGQLWEVEDLKDWLYQKVGVFEKKQYPDGTINYNPITLSRMTKEQASEFITRVIDYIEDNHPECIIPPDLRNCWLLHITEKEIEELKYFNFPDRDLSYLAYIRKQSCLYSGKFGCEAAHISLPGYGGMSQKPPDWLAIPLEVNVHRGQAHQEGHSNIIKGLNLYGFDVITYCKLNYRRWKLKK